MAGLKNDIHEVEKRDIIMMGYGGVVPIAEIAGIRTAVLENKAMYPRS
ncbi:hypothetical protein [Desulfobacter postgatei]|nr:hypothetical protein [Desulfobacter postgatei]